MNNTPTADAQLHAAAVEIMTNNFDGSIFAAAKHTGWLSQEEFDILIDSTCPDYMEDYDEYTEFKETFTLFMFLVTGGNYD